MVRHARRSGRRAPRVMCSLAVGPHRQLLALSSQALLAYGQRQGWDVVISTENLSEGRPPAWGKVRLVQRLLQHYDDVLWVDADAIVVDLERDVLQAATPRQDLHLVNHVLPGVPDGVPNSGVFLLSPSHWSRSFLARLWAQPALVDHNWWENAALLELLGYSLDAPHGLVAATEDLRHVGQLPLEWNSVPGTFEVESAVIRHHARADHDNFARRLAALADDLSSAVDRHPTLFRA